VEIRDRAGRSSLRVTKDRVVDAVKEVANSLSHR